MNTKGFSLVEVVVTLGIVGIIGSVSLVTYNTMQRTNEVKHSSYVYADALKSSMIKAKAMEYDTDWGVKISSSSVIVFSGSSYAGRTSSRDSVYDISSNLNISGISEMVFSKITDTPTTSGTTTFSSDFGTSSVFVSTLGMITY